MSDEKKWIVVTGASSGIGTAIATEGAKRGYGLVLVARRKDRLEELAQQLAKAHRAETLVVAVDLGDSDGVAKLIAATTAKGIVPQVVFNNAGYGSYGYFLAQDVNRELSMIDLNCRSLVEIAYQYGRQMQARGSGTLVNVGSVLSFMPTAYMAVYAATKAFVLSFSQALEVELKPSGISVVALCPGPTDTEFSGVAKFPTPGGAGAKSPIVETAADVSRTAWNAVDRKRAVAVSGTGNNVMAFFLRHAPRMVIAKISSSFKPA